MEGTKLWGLIMKSPESFWVGSSGSGKIAAGVTSLERWCFFFFSERECSTSDMAMGSVVDVKGGATVKCGGEMGEL